VTYEKPSYGYGIVKSIEDLTEGRHQIKLGTVYTLLQRMEKSNLLTSKWEKSKKTPDKKIYQATEKGENLLKEWLETIIDRKKMMEKMAIFYLKHFGEKTNDK
jgi:PadR family transcriptional regulator, regulatory protein PadR